MRKMHVTQQFFFFEAIDLQGHFFEKKKIIFRYGLGECGYQISGLYHFSFGQQVPSEPTDPHIYKWIKENTLSLRQVDFEKNFGNVYTKF